MLFEIKSRWTGEVKFSLETDSLRLAVIAAVGAKADLRGADLRGADLRGAYLRDADLSDADLRDADLRGAYLRDADLSDADLRGAYLRGADLRGADLRGAYLSGADLRGADLRGAYLSDADLRGADLRDIKNDLFDVLLRASHEVEGLALALREGRVDGTVYQGECACLVGTIANLRHCDLNSVPNLTPNSSRPAERWFFGIRPGDTPEKSNVTKITLEWIDEFQKLLKAARS